MSTINQLNLSNIQLFNQWDKIYDIWKKKHGTVKYLRNDTYEKNCRKNNQHTYYYFIDYDDGTFDTYVNGNDLKIDY